MFYGTQFSNFSTASRYEYRGVDFPKPFLLVIPVRGGKGCCRCHEPVEFCLTRSPCCSWGHDHRSRPRPCLEGRKNQRHRCLVCQYGNAPAIGSCVVGFDYRNGLGVAVDTRLANPAGRCWTLGGHVGRICNCAPNERILYLQPRARLGVCRHHFRCGDRCRNSRRRSMVIRQRVFYRTVQRLERSRHHSNRRDRWSQRPAWSLLAPNKNGLVQGSGNSAQVQSKSKQVRSKRATQNEQLKSVNRLVDKTSVSIFQDNSKGNCDTASQRHQPSRASYKKHQGTNRVLHRCARR